MTSSLVVYSGKQDGETETNVQSWPQLFTLKGGFILNQLFLPHPKSNLSAPETLVLDGYPEGIWTLLVRQTGYAPNSID